MKTKIMLLAVIVAAFAARAATTIDPANKYAYGANIGWMDWRGDTNNGAVIGEYVCSGYIYSANVGWINLGSGAPANQIQYQNNSATDFGVNQDGLGNLRGYAYGANIGWIVFETNGAPKVNLLTGQLSGSVWSANCGWISLYNKYLPVTLQTDTIAPGADFNGDGIPDAWELQNFGTISIDPNADPDHDGMSNLQEYLAGTNPNDPNDVFRITYIARGDVLPNFTTLHWMTKPTRVYEVQYRGVLDSSASWTDWSSSESGSITFDTGYDTGNTNIMEFYRVKAYRPLMP